MRRAALTYLLGFFLLLYSCTDSLERTDVQPEAGEMRVEFVIPGQETVMTRSIDPDGAEISSVWLFLFDGDGYYAGRVRAGSVTYNPGEGETGKGNASGTFSVSQIPSSVKTIHFIANYNGADVDDSGLLHLTEEEVMTRFTTSSGRLVYWGRVTSADQGFDLTGTNPSVPKVTFYRNQASVTYKVNDGVELQVDGFAVVNTYARGTVAPYNSGASDPFAFTTASDFVTLCTGDELVKATDPTDIVGLAPGEMLYVFEHDNMEDDPLSVIFKIRTDNDQDARYYRLMVVDDGYELMKIRRNHRYVFTFTGVPSSTMGYSTFAGAVGGVAANNVWVSIDEDLPSVGDGNSSLTVEDGTSRIFMEDDRDADGCCSVYFTYDSGTEGGDVEPVVTWLSNEGLSDPAGLKIAATGEPDRWQIRFPVGEASAEPQYGILRIKAGQYVRTVRIIYLTSFEFAPVWTSSSVPNLAGQPVSVVFNIPETYPEELFPVKCRISSNLFGINTENGQQHLEVVEEETVFTYEDENGNEVTVTKDWDYKYVYVAEKPGLQRVDFKTLTAFGDGDKPEWFLEAPYFKTVRREIDMMTGVDSESQRIVISETAAGESGGGLGSYTRELPPVKGYEFDLKFSLTGGGVPGGTNVRIYLDENVDIRRDDLQKGTLTDWLYAPDAGRYVIFTVPDGVGNSDEFSIPLITVNARSAGFARLAAAGMDNGDDPAHCYKSAIVTRTNSPEAYDFDLMFIDGGQETDTKVLQYGTGQEVTLCIHPQIQNVTTPACSLLLKAGNLKPASNETARWDEALGGYVFTYEAGGLGATGHTELKMVTDGPVSACSIVISEISGNIAFNDDVLTLANTPISGRVTVAFNDPAAGFNTTNPFFAIERSDGTRVGELTVTAAVGTSAADYNLTLFAEHDFTDNEDLTVLFSPSGTSDIYYAHTTLNLLLAYPDLTLVLQQ